MTREAIIARTIETINRLPKEKIIEVSDFVDFMSKKYEDQILTAGIQKLASENQTFHFLAEDQELYSLSDLKDRYHE